MTEVVWAYAKINLHIDVTAKRADGYHDVENIMQSITLCDRVEVKKKESGIALFCDAADQPCDSGNIAYRAAEAFFAASGCIGGAEITIEKHIPVAAGMAGGSTDAAAVLVALSRLYGSPLTYDELCAVGASLGADVPFCIKGGCAYSAGKGDAPVPFSPLPPDTVLLVACGGEGVSTPWAYRALDCDNGDFVEYTPEGTEQLRLVLESDEPSRFEEQLFNIFERSILPLRPVAAKLKELMLECGARGAMMSGSGPSVFGVFESTDKALSAKGKIVELGYFAEVVAPAEERML